MSFLSPYGNEVESLAEEVKKIYGPNTDAYKFACDVLINIKNRRQQAIFNKHRELFASNFKSKNSEIMVDACSLF